MGGNVCCSVSYYLLLICFSIYSPPSQGGAGGGSSSFLLLRHAEPVNVHPAAVVGDHVGTGAEGTHLGTYPLAFAHAEGLAQFLELLAVGAVEEVAGHHAVTLVGKGFLLCGIGAELGLQPDGAVGHCYRFLHLFRLALVGLLALHLTQHQSLLGVLQDEAGIVKDFGIYAVASGRICVAGINTNNIDKVVEAIAAVVKR